MIDKKIVRNNFSKNAKNYERHATIQKKIANDLINMISIKSRQDMKILEIGAGTGIFTELLIKRYPNAIITINDISEDMIEILKLKKLSKNLKYNVSDAENEFFNQKYDLIVSNATFQWFQDFYGSLSKFYNMLEDSGELVFSFFGHRTYNELKETTKNVIGDINYSQNFISKVDLKNNLISKKYKFEVKEEQILEYYDTFYDMLKKIKQLGTSSGLKKRKVLTRNSLIKMKDYYTENFVLNNKIYLTNNVIFCKIKKEI